MLVEGFGGWGGGQCQSKALDLVLGEFCVNGHSCATDYQALSLFSEEALANVFHTLPCLRL